MVDDDESDGSSGDQDRGEIPAVDVEQPQELTSLRDEIKATRKSVKDLWIAFAVLVGVLWVVGLTWSLWEPSTPPPSQRDDNLSELLAAREHCYGSTEEMAAARQRALAGIDHMKWERKILADSQSPQSDLHVQMFGPPPASQPPIPTIVKTTDDPKCFTVQEGLGP